MSSLLRYHALNHIIECFSHISGFNPFAPTRRMDRNRKLHLFNIFLAFFSTFWSVSQAGTGVEIIKRAMGMGIFLQTLTKGILIVLNADIYQQLIADTEKLYLQKGEKAQAVMAATIGSAEKVCKVIMLMNSSAVIIFCIYPFVAIFVLEKLNLMFPFFLPLLDPESYAGFIVNSLCHTVLIVYTLLFHNAFDVAFACFTLHAVAMVNLIQIAYEELGEFARQCKRGSEADMKFVSQKLKDIVEAQNEFDRYVEKINNFYRWPCFATSSTSLFSICIALVLIIIVRWPLAYGLCWALIGQIFAAYINGEVVSYQYERLNNFIYEFPWYTLRVADQKMIAFMLQRSQRPQNMMILFAGPLNLETFTIICNAIYSYFNVCQTFLENEA